jgi:large subunit ribosomal protein L25
LSIPDKLQISIKDLKIGDSLTAADVQLPEGVNLLSDPEMIVVHCVEPVEEEEAAAAGAAEPEIIGRKAGEEEGEEG